MPQKIQDLIERNIRTLSNSLSVKSNVHTKSLAARGLDCAEQIFQITALNKLLKAEDENNLHDQLREPWQTNKELQENTNTLTQEQENLNTINKLGTNSSNLAGRNSSAQKQNNNS